MSFRNARRCPKSTAFSVTMYAMGALFLVQNSYFVARHVIPLFAERFETCQLNSTNSSICKMRTDEDIPPIGADPTKIPNARTIKNILMGEAKDVKRRYKPSAKDVEKLANVYELVYAFVAEFRNNSIPIFVGYGSHIGARRHHGIIPFGEKDVDLHVFSTDEPKVRSVIASALNKTTHGEMIQPPDEADFGYQLLYDKKSLPGRFSHYIDFWLFEFERFSPDSISCVGRYRHGCHNWYTHFHGKNPPTFDRGDYFPPAYQVFGSHKVPIPARTAEIEAFHYGSEEDWNTTCGSHRRWANGRWKRVPKGERSCAPLYEKFPFVFSSGGRERLRQGDVTLHESTSVGRTRDNRTSDVDD